MPQGRRVDKGKLNPLALRTVYFFKRLNDDHLSKVFSWADVRVYPRGTTLITQGTTRDRKFYVVYQGNLIATHSVEGTEKELGQIAQGEAFGEMALLDDPRSASVRTQSEAVLMVYDGTKFKDALESEREIGYLVYEALLDNVTKRQRKSNEERRRMVEEIRSLHKSKDRYARRNRTLEEECKTLKDKLKSGV